jgi:hypothetical protein
MRLTRWEGRDEDGPRAVLIRRDHFPTAMQEALRKLARLEDEEEQRGNIPQSADADSPL